ncbi:jhy protein homolog isoform X2 [Pantherophis guttatus]|uniref:Jhy protein homolog isoform X2 n=1 Tax=Pantherophis guttatus TaxID=94885 RepID=A0ABM3YSU5_PANGU|nr:jhy protein homolog isoform X2 [Pantherophis guttatus]
MKRGNPENESIRGNIVDKYSELRYNPNWKDSPEGRSFLELEDSHQNELENFSLTSLDLTCCLSQGGILSKNVQLQESPRNISSAIAGELWSPSGDEPGAGRDRPSRLEKKGRKAGVNHHYDSNESLASSGCRVRFKEPPKPRPDKDFIEKNKNTLGLGTQQNKSYLRLHGKKQREEGFEEKPLAPHPVKRSLSPTARLIQAVEQHHREISQLANDHLARNHLASMFPPIIQRGESDSQLHLESGEEAQPVLSRSNSEGYLLQMEKQKERKGKKENRKGSRAKGYTKMDVRLGGLGPDYETIKEKSEKIKHQKVYAKQVNEQNLKNMSSTRKPQSKTENKSVVSRQKALEYAKTIPKPRLFVSRSSEEETKEEKNLARTLNGENLPPISSLESLQNRHEKEKQVVAAFKTLHIV